MTDEEKRARAAERSRLYRKRKGRLYRKKNRERMRLVRAKKP